MVARLDSLHLAFACRRADVAADGAEAAHRGDVLDLPGPRLEAVLRRGERAHRAQLGDVPREVTLVRLVLEGRDHRLRASVDRDELSVLGDRLAEAGAPVAEDAAFAVECDQRGDRDRLLERALGELHARVARAVAERQVLQRAFAAFVADRAVEGVVDEDELERGVLAVGGLLGTARRAHDHPVLRRQRAPGLELRQPFDLDEAHPASANRRPEARLVTEHRDLEPCGCSGLDHPSPLRHLHGPLVNGDGDEIGCPLRHAVSFSNACGGAFLV